MVKGVLLTTAIAGLCVNAYAQAPYSSNSTQSQVPQDQVHVYENDSAVQYSASSQSTVTYQQQKAPPSRNWDLSVMAGVKNKAKYSGADQSNDNVIVGVLGEYRMGTAQRIFIATNTGLEFPYSTDTGLAYALSLTPNFEIGGGLGYREGRDSSSAGILTGMKDVEDTATGMIFANYKLSNFDLQVKFEAGLDSDNDGTTTEFSAGYKHSFTPKLALGTRVATVYGNGTYMEQNYSVLPRDIRPGRPYYKADSGFSEASLKVFGTYTIAGPHSLLATAKYTELLGDAKDSPIVEDESDIAVLFGYSYKF